MLKKRKKERKGGTSLELPQGAKNPHFHYRGHRFESWSGKLESCMLQPKHNFKKFLKMLFKKKIISTPIPRSTQKLIQDGT